MRLVEVDRLTDQDLGRIYDEYIGSDVVDDRGADLSFEGEESGKNSEFVAVSAKSETG